MGQGQNPPRRLRSRHRYIRQEDGNTLGISKILALYGG